MRRRVPQVQSQYEEEITRLVEALLALTDAAEHDMKMNQGGDNHEGEPESSGGWWSLATENAIRDARAVLRSATEPNADAPAAWRAAKAEIDSGWPDAATETKGEPT